jgi:hypothetical protein
MAEVNPLLPRKSILGYKAEASLGVGETITASECVVRAYDAQLRVVRDMIEVPAQSDLGHGPIVPSAAYTDLAFWTYAHGKGASGLPGWAGLLAACGMVLSTATYIRQTDSTLYTSMTAWNFIDGWVKKGRGFMGNWRMGAESGRPARIDWNFTGGWVADPAAATMLTGTFEAVQPPTWDGTGSFTIGGSAPADRPSRFELDWGAQVSREENPNQDGGYLGGSVRNILPRLTLDINAVAAATRNWYTGLLAGSLYDIVIVLNGGSNNTLTITCDDCQLMQSPADQDASGKWQNQLVFNCTVFPTILFS